VNAASQNGPEGHAAVVGRLSLEFAPAVSHGDISALVNTCRYQLAGSPSAAMPELLERLARYRLEGMLAGEW
jgi:hypothetical protein